MYSCIAIAPFKPKKSLETSATACTGSRTLHFELAPTASAEEAHSPRHDLLAEAMDPGTNMQQMAAKRMCVECKLVIATLGTPHSKAQSMRYNCQQSSVVCAHAINREWNRVSAVLRTLANSLAMLFAAILTSTATLPLAQTLSRAWTTACMQKS